MRWENRKPCRGDVVRVAAGPLFHYGIYKNDDEIIQFGLNPALGRDENEPIRVCSCGMRDFLCKSNLQVLVFEEGDIFNRPEETLSLAEARIGQGGYHIIHNNCEHFVYECVTGKKYCAQTEELRQRFRNISITDFYYAAVPEREIGVVEPKIRQELIENTPNPDVKRQRYFVWKLLEYALYRSFGYKIDKLSFSVDESGKWSCEECYFSLSHCKEAVAVAVSRRPVGVDIEALAHPVSEAFAKRVLTDSELALYYEEQEEQRSDFVIEKWCAKEGLFKMGEEKFFHPDKIRTIMDVKTGTVKIKEKDYCFAVATKDIDKIRIYPEVKI